MRNTEITTSMNKSDVENALHQSAQELEMRVLTDCEVLVVAGGPEVDVESGTGG
ncbi:hypothetical protein H8L32_05155 [Undibacterium sp. CY18W]|uniref:Uncharacterized protein n=1 Tax=Undibacterium hunanense TaxID=2762292 RepID=A0ABR6ZLT8_9BURK|nr:hypothetical protein [Undibacterium hunanense]MBC3916856.1 hypothetical protein [Undibacterium hunanense]